MEENRDRRNHAKGIGDDERGIVKAKKSTSRDRGYAMKFVDTYNEIYTELHKHEMTTRQEAILACMERHVNILEHLEKDLKECQK
jgi:hypothetical protein